MTTARKTRPARPAEDEAQAHDAQVRLTRALARARWVLAWERAWPPLARVAAVLGLFLAVSWSGLWLALPPLGRMAGIAAFAALLVAAGWGLNRLRWPDRAAALARLDRESGVSHRPATAISDRMASRPDDPIGAALWRAHLARTLQAASRLKAGLPSPGLAARDPHALRALVLLAVVAAFFAAPGAHLSRIGAAFHWQGIGTPVAYRLDAWVDPPGYTGRPPLVLPGLRSDDAGTLHAAAHTVPAGSVLVTRASGIDPAGLKLEGGVSEIKTEPGAEGASAPAAGERRFTVSDQADVSFTAPDGRAVMWHLKVMADEPPAISFTKDPQAGLRNTLVLTYRIDDDYGVKEAQALFAPVPPEPPLFPRPGAASEPAPSRPLVAPPDFALALPPGGRVGVAQTTRDLVAHPWAGALVRLTLVARDAAGHEARSGTRTLRLPARPFTKPLARALIDERRRLAFDPAGYPRLSSVLEALSLAPDRLGISAPEYLGLRTAKWRVDHARSDDDLRGVVDYLWEMAVFIEDGTLSEAERELKAAQEALRQAIENGAGDAEIQKLAEALRQAMEKMMRQLAEQARRDGGTDARPLDSGTRVVRPQDLQRMLDRIEDLARSGNRDAARQLLDQLQAMMENLKPGSRQAGRQQGRQQGELGAMIQEQQRLRDRTFRQGQQGQQGQPGEQGGQEGENPFGQLQQGQQELRQRLGRMLEELRRMQRQAPGAGQPSDGQGGDQGDQGEALDKAGEALGRAERAMRDAEQALGQGEGQGALDAEGRALQALRQGAQAMAEGQRGNPGGSGPGMPSEDAATRTDPMGRPLRSQDYGDDFTVKVPDEVDAQRARRVLEELRRRIEDLGRPQMELDYLERLLDGL